MGSFLLKLSALPVFLLSATPLLADSQDMGRGDSIWQTLMMVGIAVFFFYFILWRPENKRRKAMEEKRSGMKKGDRVTAMGIVGTVDRIKDHTVIVKMVDGAKIEFLKAAISEVSAKEEGQEDAAEPATAS